MKTPTVVALGVFFLQWQGASDVSTSVLLNVFAVAFGTVDDRGANMADVPDFRPGSAGCAEAADRTGACPVDRAVDGAPPCCCARALTAAVAAARTIVTCIAKWHVAVAGDRKRRLVMIVMSMSLIDVVETRTITPR